MYRFILKNLKDEFEAENIVQNTFEKLWIRVNEVQFEKAKAYLFKTAYHNMIDIIRSNKKFVLMDEALTEQLETGRKEIHGLRQGLEMALERLPEKYRSVVLLKDYEGYSYQEIADIMVISLDQVKVNLYRARIALKNYIGKKEVLI